MNQGSGRGQRDATRNDPRNDHRAEPRRRETNQGYDAQYAQMRDGYGRWRDGDRLQQSHDGKSREDTGRPVTEDWERQGKDSEQERE